MDRVDNIYKKYEIINSLKESDKIVEDADNDYVFGTMALAYALGCYDEKYESLSSNFYDFILCNYKKDLDPYYTFCSDHKNDNDIDILFVLFSLIKEQEQIYAESEDYSIFRQKLINSITRFIGDKDRDKAAKVVDLYLSIYFGSLTFIGDERYSDRAISNILLYGATSKEYDYNVDLNTYAKYAMTEYFKHANSRLQKKRKSNEDDSVIFKYADIHKEKVKDKDYFNNDEDDFDISCRKLFRIHDCLELNLHKKYLGKKIKQSSLFANPNYIKYCLDYPEMDTILFGDDKNDFYEYIVGLVGKYLSNYKISGIFIVPNTYNYLNTYDSLKLFIVTRDKKDYDSMLEQLYSLLPFFNEILLEKYGLSFILTPVYKPLLKDNECFGDTLCDSEVIILDRKRFLKKNKIKGLEYRNDDIKKLVKSKN